MSKLQLGQIIITANARHTLDIQSITAAIKRHSAGDWGDVSEDDWKSNDNATLGGGRILSVYKDINGVTFWIITEWDRSYTTVLLPEDY